MCFFIRVVTDEGRHVARAVIALPEMNSGLRDTDARLEEAAGLAAAIGLDETERLSYRVRQPKPAP